MQDKLAVIWSAPDEGVAKNMVFMYAKNSRLKDWWPHVTLVIWGPSAEFITNNATVQQELEDAQAAGVEVVACKACADNYGVSDKLSALGVEVKYMGQPLTDMLKEGWHVLTF